MQFTITVGPKGKAPQHATRLRWTQRGWRMVLPEVIEEPILGVESATPWLDPSLRNEADEEARVE